MQLSLPKRLRMSALMAGGTHQLQRGGEIDSNLPRFHPIVQELKEKIQLERWEQLFEDAVDCARKCDIPQVNRIVSLQDYLTDMNDWLSWVPEENAGGDACYNRLATFYYVLNQAPLKSLQSGCSWNDFEKPLTWLSRWLQRYACALGDFLHTPESISPDSIQSFRESPIWRLQDYIEPEHGFPTFNSFFAREINLELRPIDSPEDQTIIVSPADCRFEGYLKICKQSTIVTKHIEWEIERLVGANEYKGRFTGGIFLHASLAPHNYHRFHAPLSGVVLEKQLISGQVALSLKHKHDSQGIEYLDFREAMDAPGFQAAQTRGVIILDTAVGLVTVAAIGMAQVSSVVMTIEKGQDLSKGQEMGYFQYGGSDIVLMFEERIPIELGAQIGNFWKMGMGIARVVSNST